MKKDVYLTFKTDYKTHYHLKTLAHMLGKTQPEFIDEICKDYINTIITYAKEMEQENGNTDSNMGNP